MVEVWDKIYLFYCFSLVSFNPLVCLKVFYIISKIVFKDRMSEFSWPVDCGGKRAFLQHSLSHHLYVPHEVQQIPSRQVTDKPESLSINLITSQ